MLQLDRKVRQSGTQYRQAEVEQGLPIQKPASGDEDDTRNGDDAYVAGDDRPSFAHARFLAMKLRRLQVSRYPPDSTFVSRSMASTIAVRKGARTLWGRCFINGTRLG